MQPKEFEVQVTQIPDLVVPILAHPHVAADIKSLAQAEAWGRENLHGIVYWMPSKKRVYAERCVCDMAGDNTSCRVHHPAGR